MPTPKFAGFLFLLAGWGIVLSAVALLRSPAAMSVFALAGFGVEILGLVLAFRAHRRYAGSGVSAGRRP